MLFIVFALGVAKLLENLNILYDITVVSVYDTENLIHKVVKGFYTHNRNTLVNKSEKVS